MKGTCFGDASVEKKVVEVVDNVEDSCVAVDIGEDSYADSEGA